MEEKFNMISCNSEYYRAKNRLYSCNLTLEKWGEYFENSGEFQIELGCGEVEHTELLAKAYEHTLNHLKNMQESFLESLIQSATIEYNLIWEFQSHFTSDEYYEEQLEFYHELLDKRTLKKHIIPDRIMFLPILEKELCYMGIRLSEIKETEEDVDRVPQFWVVFDSEYVVNITEESGGIMDKVLCRQVEKYKETDSPIYVSMWHTHSETQNKKRLSTKIKGNLPSFLGRDGILTKFEKLSPYLSCMCMEPVTEDKEPFYTLPRGARPLGDYGIEQIYLIKKIVGKKWENCPVFYADLEFSEVNPLAENLVTFLKLACMAGSFLAVAGAVDVSTSEYERYLEGMQMDPEADAVIRLIEESFPLPPIESVHAYVNNLQRNKILKEMGEKLYRQIHKKRGWDTESIGKEKE